MPEGLKIAAGVTEGAVLAGKYRVERVLGQGGMGVVVAARHIELDEQVAIKFLLGPMLQDGAAVARFQREAKAVVRIKSEHVVRVFDVGRLEDGAPYMVMEYLEGSDLADWLQKYGALPIAQAVDFVVMACVAVAEAHALGIIHRDLKPANLFCLRRSDGQLSIKVLDFGISKLMEAPGAGMSFTQTSAMMGSPLYMSPEQFRSTKNVDARTDIWALGAILFELVTRQPPFTAETVPELAIKIATESPPSAAQLRPDVPPALAAVIAKCLEREPERRHADVAALAIALAPFTTPAARLLVDRVVGIAGKRDTAGGTSPGVPPSQEAVSHAEGKTAPAIHWTSDGTPRRRRLPLTLAVLSAAGIAAALVWWRTERALPDTPPGVSAQVALTPPVSAATPRPAPASPESPPAPVATPEIPPKAPATPPVAEPVVAPVEPEPAPRDRRKRTPAPSGKRAAAPTAASPTPAAPATPAAPPPSPTPRANNCDPPFFFDARGNRVFKQECL